MLYAFIGVVILALLILLSYTYFLICRIAKQFLKKKVSLISLILALLVFLPLFINPTSIWLIFIYHLLFAALVIDTIYFIFKKKINFSKVIKYKNFLILPLVFAIVMTSYASYNAGNVVRKEYTVATAKDIRAEGYKIALISDVHFGNVLTIEEVQEIANKISNEENLDALILAGDIVDERTNVEDYDKLFVTLGSIKTKLGTYYVHGNHDENRYSTPTDSRETKLMNAITNAEIKFLNEESTQLAEDLTLTGRIDYSYNRTGVRKTSAELIADLNKEQFLIVADHQPYVYAENKNAGYDLQVSGHTHAGQIWPFGVITRNIDFDYGQLIEQNFNLIVSSGFGVWGYPARTEEHSEYVIINIAKK